MYFHDIGGKSGQAELYKKMLYEWPMLTIVKFLDIGSWFTELRRLKLQYSIDLLCRHYNSILITVRHCKAKRLEEDSFL